MSIKLKHFELFSTTSCPYGISFPEWTAKWWKWALSLPLKNNPVNDLKGKNSNINQMGPVWFLAGTTGGIVNKKCIVPASKAILLPILNHGGTLADSPGIHTEDELASFTSREMDIISGLKAEVDNFTLSDLQNYRVRSPVFDVSLPESNLFNGTPGPTRGVSDGYWLFLGPLPRGNHKIHTFGSCMSGKIKIDTNYEISVC